MTTHDDHCDPSDDETFAAIGVAALSLLDGGDPLVAAVTTRDLFEIDGVGTRCATVADMAAANGDTLKEVVTVVLRGYPAHSWPTDLRDELVGLGRRVEATLGEGFDDETPSFVDTVEWTPPASAP